MKRRTDPTQQQPSAATIAKETAAAAASTPTRAAEVNYDWTTQQAPEGSAGPRTVAANIEEGRRAGDLIALKVKPSDGPAANPDAVGPGDLLTITIGKETYYPGGKERFNGFDVGPLSLTVTIRQGESSAAAWARGRTVLEQLHEAELQLRIDEFMDNHGRVKAAVRGE